VNEYVAMFVGVPMMGAFIGAMALIFATRMASKH
jgi:hypothetical protein